MEPGSNAWDKNFGRLKSFKWKKDWQSFIVDELLYCCVLIFCSCWAVSKITWTAVRNFKNWANPGLFFIYFCLFKHTLQYLQQIIVKKCLWSIRCRESNSKPLEPLDQGSHPMAVRNLSNSQLTWKHCRQVEHEVSWAALLSQQLLTPATQSHADSNNIRTSVINTLFIFILFEQHFKEKL